MFCWLPEGCPGPASICSSFYPDFLLAEYLLTPEIRQITFKTFYARRAFRILPLYQLDCVLTLAGFLLWTRANRPASMNPLFLGTLPWFTYAPIPAKLLDGFSKHYVGRCPHRNLVPSDRGTILSDSALVDTPRSHSLAELGIAGSHRCSSNHAHDHILRIQKWSRR